MAAEIIQLERQVSARRDSLVHVDATPEAVRSQLWFPGRFRSVSSCSEGKLRRPRPGRATRGRGEHVAACLCGRKGWRPCREREALGCRESRGDLAFLERREKIAKRGSGKTARWSLA